MGKQSYTKNNPRILKSTPISEQATPKRVKTHELAENNHNAAIAEAIEMGAIPWWLSGLRSNDQAALELGAGTTHRDRSNEQATTMSE